MRHVPMPLRSYRTWLCFNVCAMPLWVLALILETTWAYLWGSFIEFRLAWRYELRDSWASLWTRFRPDAYHKARWRHRMGCSR